MGSGRVVFGRQVVAVLNLAAAENPATAALLARAQAEGRLERIAGGEPKSAILAVDDHGTQRVYLSPISAATLKGRGGAFAGV